MRQLEHVIGAPAEIGGVAFLADAEATDGHAVDRLDVRRQLVAPRHVVGGARRQDFDLGMPGEMFGDVARVKLGAAVDCRPVALNDDCEFHSSPGPGSSVSGPDIESAAISLSMLSAAVSWPPTASRTASASGADVAGA